MATVIRIIVCGTASIEVINFESDTILSHVLHMKCDQSAKVLMAAGANPNYEDDFGAKHVPFPKRFSNVDPQVINAFVDEQLHDLDIESTMGDITAFQLF